ncbi:MAG: 2-C-methyl-D-erythritol 2,4-cyclodiphosphate synthase [Nitrospinota bacterium]
MRIGHGFDVHRLVTGRKLVLGGVTIPFAKGLLGHSDADVLLHAMMDALLGAAAAGDLGKHFPDTSSRFKDAGSLSLLKTVCDEISGRGYCVYNIDSTIVAEAPKLSAFVSQMVVNVSKVVRVPEGCVSVKATTTEGLGFTGKGEGIAAFAVVTLKKTS